jgi:small subunit ribosomal protein S16
VLSHPIGKSSAHAKSSIPTFNLTPASIAKSTPTRHNGITDTSRPLRQEARPFLQHRRRARPVRPNHSPLPHATLRLHARPLLYTTNPLTSPLSTARNSRPLEVLGTYDPKPQPPRPGDTHGRPWKDIRLDISRARYWVGVGAQPSDTAWRLLSMVGILEPQFRVGQVQGQVVRADSAAKSLIPESSGDGVKTKEG